MCSSRYMYTNNILYYTLAVTTIGTSILVGVVKGAEAIPSDNISMVLACKH